MIDHPISNSAHWLISLLVLLHCLCLSGCGVSDEPETNSEYINIPEQITVKETSASFSVNANCEWIITGLPNWLYLSTNTGLGSQTIDITCEVNPSETDMRVAKITVSTTDRKISKTMQVVQMPVFISLSVNPSRIEADPEGGEYKIDIKSNSEWNVSGTEDWIILDCNSGDGDGTIGLIVSSNQTDKERSATIVFTVTPTTKSVVTITQKKDDTTLQIEKNRIETNAKAGTYKLALIGDAKWTASSNERWCSIDITNGKGSASINIHLDDNLSQRARYATVLIETTKGDQICSIIQRGATFPEFNTINVTDVERYSVSAIVRCMSEFEITNCGFYISETNITPSPSDMIVLCDTRGYEIEVKAKIENLKSGHTYYIRAFAESAIGTSYSNVATFKTSGLTPDINDNPIPEP